MEPQSQSSTLVLVRMPAPSSFGAQSLFAAMSQPGAIVDEQEAMMNMIHDSGDHKDGKVEDSWPESDTQQMDTQIQTPTRSTLNSRRRLVRW